MVLGRTEKASGWGERLAHPTTRPPTSWSMGGAGWTKHPPSQAVGHFKAPNLGGGGPVGPWAHHNSLSRPPWVHCPPRRRLPEQYPAQVQVGGGVPWGGLSRTVQGGRVGPVVGAGERSLGKNPTGSLHWGGGLEQLCREGCGVRAVSLISSQV